MEAHSVLFEIARQDLKAADLLLEKKLYRHSIFFLQQSIEKLLKSLAIWTRIINMDQCKKDIGHIAHTIYLKFIDNFSKHVIPDTAIPVLEKMGLGREYIEELTLGANQSRTLLSKYSKRGSLSLSLSSTDLLPRMLAEIQRDMQEMKKAKLELQKQSERLSEKEVEEFSKRLPQYVDDMLPREIADPLRKAFEHITPHMTVGVTRVVLRESLVNFAVPRREFFFCWLSLLPLSLVFSAHEDATRYPDADFNPLEAYVENTPLVQMLGSFMEITWEICTSLTDVYAKMKPLNLG